MDHGFSSSEVFPPNPIPTTSKECAPIPPNACLVKSTPSCLNLSAVSLTHSEIAKDIVKSSLYPLIASARLPFHINVNNSSMVLEERIVISFSLTHCSNFEIIRGRVLEVVENPAVMFLSSLLYLLCN